MSIEGASAGDKARQLRELAASTRARADQLDTRAARWEAGQLGEQRVAAALASLAGEHCQVLHDRLLHPGRSRVNLDHIVICPAGNYLIDAKNWSGEIGADQFMLWQNLHGRRRSLNNRLDAVRRMAEQLESATSAVVEPVICLAGEQAASFGSAVQVRGVAVVPLDQLAPWLLAQPRQPDATVQFASTAARFAAEFPSATDPAFRSVPGRRSHRDGAPLSPSSPSSPASSATGRNAGAPGTSRHAGALWRPAARRQPRADGLLRLAALVGVLALLLTPAGHQVLDAVARSAGNALADGLSHQASMPTVRTWPAPCAAISDAGVSKALGHRAYRYTAANADTCSWGLTPKPAHSALGPIQISTGWQARYGSQPATGAARFVSGTRSETLVVGQFNAVPNSALPASRITQPLLITLSWQGNTLTAATARQAVVALADATAEHLPSGPTAALVQPH